MTCRHDQLYRQNNEAAGGAGCPMCAAERRKQQPDYGPASHQRTIAARHGDMTGIGWPLQAMANTVRDIEPISDLADRVALAYKESELQDYADWQHIKGDCAL